MEDVPLSYLISSINEVSLDFQNFPPLVTNVPEVIVDGALYPSNPQGIFLLPGIIISLILDSLRFGKVKLRSILDPAFEVSMLLLEFIALLNCLSILWSRLLFILIYI